MYTYTIPICNLNMGSTLEQSASSILDQVTDDFEVLVVDGGSDDESLSILERLNTEYEHFRYIELNRDPDRHLGGDREISIQESNGEYLLLHLDADDYYHEGIRDFTTVYHQIESQSNKEVVLVGSHITMLSRKHMLRLGSYRNLPAAEDIDLWRRAVVDDDTLYIWLDMDFFCETIRQERGPRAKMRRTLRMKSSEFQIGISLWSYLRWDIRQSSGLKIGYNVLLSLLAYTQSLRREQYDTVNGPSKQRSVRKAITDAYSLAEVENELGIKIDYSMLSKKACKYFTPT